eukprot:scaffold1529_cov180-Ochromonas_danica.AAC.1
MVLDLEYASMFCVRMQNDGLERKEESVGREGARDGDGRLNINNKTDRRRCKTTRRVLFLFELPVLLAREVTQMQGTEQSPLPEAKNCFFRK